MMTAERVVKLGEDATVYSLQSGVFGQTMRMTEAEARQLLSLLLEEFEPKVDLRVSPTEFNLALTCGKIDAIKAYRMRTGAGLKEAKDAIEAEPGIVFKQY
jgi:ribosomal protein L7/L12